MGNVTKVADVFRTTGQPTITYVHRDAGHFENRLKSYLDEKGQLCLITGPSKTGKSTLYKRVLEERGNVPLVVQCTSGRTCDEIWKVALQEINFDQVKSSTKAYTAGGSVAVETGAKFGWKWLAEVTGKFTGTIKHDVSEGEVRERILAKPSPDLLIPVLRETNLVLILEDFHYLDDKEKVLLFQQWKRFVDNEITVIVLGTTHRAVDIANSNKDLIGRIAQIDVAQWSEEDLEKICMKGFQHLGIKIEMSVLKKICIESVGLPIIVQQICLQAINRNSIFTVSDAKKSKVKFLSDVNIKNSFTEVANQKYSQFSSYYKTLIRGPREKSRKYKTYELVLACFTVDPIAFSLNRHEIDSRLLKLKISQAEKPPAASLNSTLGALKKFQSKRKFELLEWMPTEDTLYIVEPSFLFYVRWRNKREDDGGIQLDLFEELLESIRTSLVG